MISSNVGYSEEEWREEAPSSVVPLKNLILPSIHQVKFGRFWKVYIRFLDVTPNNDVQRMSVKELRSLSGTQIIHTQSSPMSEIVHAVETSVLRNLSSPQSYWEPCHIPKQFT
jgi:hypothetical protein